ncbi:MAG TPA: PH domain-containing protein, partial [Streptosporangiaceae bacterium]|nr:PH domain-containing protein [Streptosporangiaceae bacterium]
MDKPQTFRSPTALVVWVVWLLFAVGNWIDLAVQGRDHASVVAAAVLLLATGVAYVTAQRPRVIVDDAGMTVRNPVRDHRISWAAITDVDLMDLLRVHCTLGERRKTVSAWAVHYSRRRQYSADVKARRAAARTAGGRPSLFGGLPAASRSLSYGTPAAARDTSDEATAKILVRLINERATAARSEALRTASTISASTDSSAAPSTTLATAAPSTSAPTSTAPSTTAPTSTAPTSSAPTSTAPTSTAPSTTAPTST